MTAGKNALETSMAKCSRHPDVEIRYTRVLCRAQTWSPR